MTIFGFAQRDLVNLSNMWIELRRGESQEGMKGMDRPGGHRRVGGWFGIELPTAHSRKNERFIIDSSQSNSLMIHTYML